MATYEDMAVLLRLGYYNHVTSAELDNAIRLQPALEAFLSQKKDECSTLEDGYAALDAIVGDGMGKGNAT
jgi:flagellum-specific ATP synthase